MTWKQGWKTCTKLKNRKLEDEKDWYNLHFTMKAGLLNARWLGRVVFHERAFSHTIPDSQGQQSSNKLGFMVSLYFRRWSQSWLQMLGCIVIVLCLTLLEPLTPSCMATKRVVRCSAWARWASNCSSRDMNTHSRISSSAKEKKGGGKWNTCNQG